MLDHEAYFCKHLKGHTENQQREYQLHVLYLIEKATIILKFEPRPPIFAKLLIIINSTGTVLSEWTTQEGIPSFFFLQQIMGLCFPKRMFS